MNSCFAAIEVKKVLSVLRCEWAWTYVVQASKSHFGVTTAEAAEVCSDFSLNHDLCEESNNFRDHFFICCTWNLKTPAEIIGHTPPHNSQTFVLSISILNVDLFLNKSKWINSQCFPTRSCCLLLENVCSKLERFSKLSHACKFERVSFPTKNKREWIYLEKLMAMCLFSFLLRPVTGILSSGFWKVLSKFQVDGNWWKSMENIAIPHRSLGNKIAGFRRFKWIESDLSKLL